MAWEDGTFSAVAVLCSDPMAPDHPDRGTHTDVPARLDRLPWSPFHRLVGVALDDTRLRKSGRCIPQAFYQRDPLSPPFHVNLVLGLRFLQASLLVPLHRTSAVGTRALPTATR